jgi:hypothetical protein
MAAPVFRYMVGAAATAAAALGAQRWAARLLTRRVELIILCVCVRLAALLAGGWHASR